MAEIIGTVLAGIGGVVAKLYPAWILADFISSGISLLVIYAIGSLAGLFSEIVINTAIGAIPFPFNLLAFFYISPLYFVFQLALFIVLLLFLKKGND